MFGSVKLVDALVKMWFVADQQRRIGSNG